MEREVQIWWEAGKYLECCLSNPGVKKGQTEEGWQQWKKKFKKDDTKEEIWRVKQTDSGFGERGEKTSK